MAKLYFKYGAMSSGKSSYLLQAAYNYESSGRTILLTKPSQDVKSGQKISSRLGMSRNIDFITTPDLNLFEHVATLNTELIKNDEKSISCLLIDEAQFLTREHVNECLKIATVLNIPVMCFGLRTDFRAEGFNGSDRLLQLAHSIEEMKNICGLCGQSKATLNGRRINGEFTAKGEKIAIDVKSDPTATVQTNIDYVGLCAKCYMDNVHKFKNKGKK